jgi:hypothetical protein
MLLSSPNDNTCPYHHNTCPYNHNTCPYNHNTCPYNNNAAAIWDWKFGLRFHLPW